jgi:hypothetical protein
MNTQHLTIIVILCILLLSATVFLLEHNARFHKPPTTVTPPRQGPAVPPVQQIARPVQASASPASSSNPQLSGKSLPNPPQKSKFAYVTLISGIKIVNGARPYRGFLYNTLIMRKSLVQLGSTADFIALVGYSDDNREPYEEDMNLLRSNGISVFVLPRLLDESVKLTFAEMALLKVTPWSFVNYERVQFFDGDVMPTQNMDCFFELDHNTFTVGAVSPLNSGWYLAIPNMKSYEYLRDSAIWRLGCDWDELNGWSLPLSNFDLARRGGDKVMTLWDFNGANMDQGLLTHHFVLREGNAVLVDTDQGKARVFEKGLRQSPSVTQTMAKALDVCGGKNPTSFFAHFTGRSKPWLVDKKSNKPPNWSVKSWMQTLDSLQLPVNSSNVLDQGFNSPLGYFDINLPKRNVKCSRTED